ncbi:MAG TPA: hypothetical protein VG758_17725 [Hyphomicrobiaceae bacterium]|jgi:hypothetical protein|nr:hypothetical protein [Hyphomicrobiaceae bacterium]
MFEFGWAQWAQIVDWLADGGLRNFILDFFQLGAFRTVVWMMIGAILARYATRLWFRFVHPNQLQQSWDDLRQARRWFALERAVWTAHRRKLRLENARLRSQNKELRAKLDHLTSGMALA